MSTRKMRLTSSDFELAWTLRCSPHRHLRAACRSVMVDGTLLKDAIATLGRCDAERLTQLRYELIDELFPVKG